MQRFLDIILSSIALVLLSPILIPVVVGLRLSGEGEVFFLQDRIGAGGATFKLYKFATMLKNSPNIGTGTITVRGDPRILPLGRFLRKSKINELPQLLNIWWGDMSVIGPRPLTRQTFSAYPADVQAVVVQVRPGLSGVGSVIFRGEEDILAHGDNSVQFYHDHIAPYKGAVERWYVEHRGVGVYLLTILLTVIVVLVPKSQLQWRWFKGLPPPPGELRAALNYPE